MNMQTAHQSYTGPRGNTISAGAFHIQGPNRSVSGARVAFDRGSDGTIDRSLSVGRASGPRGSAALAAVNQQAGKTWSNYSGGLGEKESFHATIQGDPHFSVDGSINGQDVSSKFDNQDLDTRTQFAGAGFKLQTETVPWGDKGAAVVGSATVSTGFGRNRDQVTVNADGSLQVNGEETTLAAGETLKLNRSSSLSMDESGNYTVSSRNGKVTNTFDAVENPNGNYLNIESNVNDVQTVGWMQNQV